MANTPYYDRYSKFRNGNGFNIVPFGEIPKSDTDKYETYNRGVTRLDLLSYQYYNSTSYAWLIMQANPQYGSLEFNIPDGAELRIPFPLLNALGDYQRSLDKYRKYYG